MIFPADKFITKTKNASFPLTNTQDNKFQNFFCICDEYVIRLFVCIYEVIKGK
jgi:hypothetical protein